MAGREKDWDDSNEGGSPDPETLYTKEFCIGSSHASSVMRVGPPDGWEESIGLTSCVLAF